MDLISIIPPIIGVILFPILIILCGKCRAKHRAKRQKHKDKARGGDVEMGSGAGELKDGNLVVLAGAGEDVSAGGAVTATVVGSGDRNKGVVVEQQPESAVLEMLIDCFCGGDDSGGDDVGDNGGADCCCSGGGDGDGGGCGGGCGDTDEGGGDVEMATPASEQRDGNIVVLAGAGEATARIVGTYQGCCCGDGDGVVARVVVDVEINLHF
ncbi:uncharacterized protein LOC125876084 [Solanum stenotomum]|uniref:uncharacterized protein LOC125876084 n=1 Tax=Solanum stenotomum TaxID=172797 RepID=UPI0020D00755|nr:uncharacterized protein LOC125876084 [Solanum stenotomum]